MSIRFRFGEKGFYRMLNATFWVFIGLFGGGRYFGIASWNRMHILVALFAVFLMTGFSFLSARGRIFCLIGGLGCLGAVGTVIGPEKIFRFLSSYIYWLFGRPLWKEEWIVGYEIMQVLLLVLIGYLLQILLEKDFRIKLISALLLVVWLLYCFFAEKELSHVGASLILCYLLVVVVEWTQRYWKKEKSKNLQAYMLWFTPFFVIYLLLLLCMPVSPKPYDWQLFKDIYQQIRESFRTISQNVLNGDREDFDLGLSGFSESGSLGGGLLANEREIMTIQGDKGLRTNVYLIGKVYDTFDGSQWQQLNEDFSQERYLDTAETLYAVRRYNKEYLQDYLYRTELKVSYRYFTSGYLFAPLKTWSLESEGRPIYFEDMGGSLLFEEKKGYGTEYETVFYQMNLSQELFYEFLEAEQEPDMKLLENILSGLEMRNGKELTVEDLEKHRQMIYNAYLGDISLTPKVEAYLNQITQNAETDIEKLRAIEEMLSSYSYSRTPGKLPHSVVDGSSFLEYFLLESRQGYCSHFATAFVLLARAEGIPARYVQGYCVPMQSGEEIMVTSDMAHAWPEVYLENIGWIPFEPTPGYGQLRYTPWAIRQDAPTFSSDAGNGYGAGVQRPENTIGDVSKDEAEVEETARTNGWKRVLGIVLLTFGIIIVISVLVLLFERLIGRYRYQKMNEHQRYVVEIRKNLRIISKMGLERKEGETLEELQGRLNIDLGQDVMFHFVEDYEQVLYGERCADEKMIQLAKEEQSRLLQLLKQKKRWSYLYYCAFMNGYRM